MGERAYKTMKSVGISNLVSGIIIIIVGIAVGVFTIVNGARLLKRKSELLF